MGFYRANIKDHSQRVLDILGNTLEATDMLSKLKNHYFYLFISDSGKSLLCYEPVFGEIPWYLVHTYTSEDERGLELKKFLLGTGLWMCDNSKAEAFMAVIPRRLRRYGIFLRHCGARRQGTEQDCTIYTFGIDQYNDLSKKLKSLNTET